MSVFQEEEEGAWTHHADEGPSEGWFRGAVTQTPWQNRPAVTAAQEKWQKFSIFREFADNFALISLQL